VPTANFTGAKDDDGGNFNYNKKKLYNKSYILYTLKHNTSIYPLKLAGMKRYVIQHNPLQQLKSKTVCCAIKFDLFRKINVRLSFSIQKFTVFN